MDHGGGPGPLPYPSQGAEEHGQHSFEIEAGYRPELFPHPGELEEFHHGRGIGRGKEAVYRAQPFPDQDRLDRRRRGYQGEAFQEPLPRGGAQL